MTIDTKLIAEKLARKHLKNLVPYESARRLFSGAESKQQTIWLNANESPYSPQYEVDTIFFNRYPDCQPADLINAYATYSGVEKNQLLCSRGADEGIELLIRAFCEEKQSHILICPPTYGMYAISAESLNVDAKKAPLNSDFSLDLELIKSYKGEVNLVFICSPNNPTGNTVADQQIKAVLEYFADSALVVVDEAYIEFSPENSWVKALNDYPNLVILRTLSKAFGLAGLRCGFVLANQSIIDILMKVIAPYPVPAPVAQIAAKSLNNNGIKQMRAHVSELNQQKAQLIDALEQIGDVDIVTQSAANFVLIKHPRCSDLFTYLKERNILIRDQSKQLRLAGCLRITIGDESQNSQLINEIKAFEKL